MKYPINIVMTRVPSIDIPRLTLWYFSPNAHVFAQKQHHNSIPHQRNIKIASSRRNGLFDLLGRGKLIDLCASLSSMSFLDEVDNDDDCSSIPSSIAASFCNAGQSKMS